MAYHSNNVGRVLAIAPCTGQAFLHEHDEGHSECVCLLCVHGFQDATDDDGVCDAHTGLLQHCSVARFALYELECDVLQSLALWEVLQISHPLQHLPASPVTVAFDPTADLL